MELPNLKELKSLLKLCRSQGVTNLTFDGLTITFGDLPRDVGSETTEDPVESAMAMHADAEMAFWSAQADPQAVADVLSTEVM